MSSTNILDAIDKMSIMELAALIKSIEEKYGVSAAPVSAAGGAIPAAGGATEAAAEKTEYKVVLKDAGAEKIKVVKALRTITTLSLGDAKAAVDATPYVVAESASKEDAAKFKKTLEESGAKVELS